MSLFAVSVQKRGPTCKVWTAASWRETTDLHSGQREKVMKGVVKATDSNWHDKQGPSSLIIHMLALFWPITSLPKPGQISPQHLYTTFTHWAGTLSKEHQTSKSQSAFNDVFSDKASRCWINSKHSYQVFRVSFTYLFVSTVHLTWRKTTAILNIFQQKLYLFKCKGGIFLFLLSYSQHNFCKIWRKAERTSSNTFSSTKGLVILKNLKYSQKSTFCFFPP